MKIYETLVLLDPELAREGDSGVKHVQSLLEKHGGEIIRIEKYHEGKLEYEIRKRKRGVYVLSAFRMDPARLAELDRSYRLDDGVLRSLVLDRSGITVDKFFRHYEHVADPSADAPDYMSR